jgi:hypothetical protein
MLKRYPIRDEDGNPIGATVDGDDSTSYRFWVETTQKSGDSVSVLAFDETFNQPLFEMLTRAVAELSEINMHLRAITGLEPDPNGGD